jgi:hypothetical protein
MYNLEKYLNKDFPTNPIAVWPDVTRGREKEIDQSSFKLELEV